MSESKIFFVDGKSNLHKKLFYKVIDLGFNFLNGNSRKNKVLQYRTVAEIKSILNTQMSEDGINDDEVLQLLETIGSYSISQSDLNYMAFPDSGNAIYGLIADIYSKFLNQNLIAFDRSAPIATLIEIQLIEWLRELIGYEHKELLDINSLSEVSGMCTTGGHMSNHVAIMTALNHKYPQVRDFGLTILNFPPKIIVADKISHYSIISALQHLGLGNQNLICAGTNPDFTTNVSDVEKILEEHKEANDVFMVIGVAGNTRTSSIDNLSELANVCKKYDVWFHVDACHGGSLLFSKKLRDKNLEGIQYADSVAIDPHKGMFVTYPSGYIIFKKRDALVKFTRYEEQVRNGDAWDLGYITPFYGSRGFESLKLWILIYSMGKKRLSEVVEKRERDAQHVYLRIKNSLLFTLFHDMTFYRLCFVFLPEKIKNIIQQNMHGLNSNQIKSIKDCIDQYTHKLSNKIYVDGDACFDEFKLHDVGNKTLLSSNNDSRFIVMSATIGNPLYTDETIEKTLSLLFKEASGFLYEFEKDIQMLIQQNHGEQFSSADVNQKPTGPAGWS